MKKYVFSFLAAMSVLFGYDSSAQIQFINYPADTVGWVYGSSRPETYKRAKYNHDTFVVTTAIGGENNYIYHTLPVTMMGTASTFTASFDFRMDSSASCSDGLSFWFFTEFSALGRTSDEGGRLGFPDTTKGFALAMRTTGCSNNIYLKKINSTGYWFSTGSGSIVSDSNLCTPLTSQMWLVDSSWHHCVVTYMYGNITVSYDGGAVTLSGFSPITGTGHFGFMGTNGGGYSRKCIKNIQISPAMGTPAISSDSFGININKFCNGPQIIAQTSTYMPGYNLKTWYGDGSSDLSPVLSGSSGGYAILNHTYTSAGTYSIKQVLLNGTSPIDSLTTSYENIFCSTLPVKFYFDANVNCAKDSAESFIGQSILTEVDSNGIAIDTISSTSGFYYQALGAPGCIYKFKVLSMPGNFTLTCPSTGIVYDTLASGVFTAPTRYIGMNCGTGTSFDLGISAVIPVTGVHDQWGNIYVNNAYCAPTNATITLHYSPKYAGTPTQITPAAVSVSGNSITWNISALSSTQSTPVKLHYSVWKGATPLPIGDTVHSYFTIAPGTGDADTINNDQDDVDTVKAGCDPNHIWVSPDGCMPLSAATSSLKYTVNFENTGNDTAHNIYVLDTLSDYLDASSMRVMMSSHEMYVSKWKDAAGRTIVKFDFPNIKLLDSSHHGLCDGAFIYTINTKPGIPAGEKVHGRVGIYFDVNGVVLTNTVENEKGCPSSLAIPTQLQTKPTLYPNPVSDELVVKADQNVFTSFAITNSIGQEIIQKLLSGAQTRVNVKALPAGIYYVVFTGTHGREVVKFVKE